MRQVDFYTGNWLKRLTFVFSDKVRSPPAGTYNLYPSLTFYDLNGDCIKQITGTEPSDK